MTGSALFRGLAALALPLAPVAALDTATPAIMTGDAIAEGPQAIENTGGNAQFGDAKTESRVVTGPPAGPVAPPAALSVPKPVIPKNPAADAVARAHAQVEEAKARAQAQIDAARRNAEEATARAHQQAADAQARAAQQSAEARARSASASAQADAD